MPANLQSHIQELIAAEPRSVETLMDLTGKDRFAVMEALNNLKAKGLVRRNEDGLYIPA